MANTTRNTPIGALHRVMWIHIPDGFRKVDQRITNGRFSAWIGRLAYTLWNDKHPVVLVSLDSTFNVLSTLVYPILGIPCG